MRSLVALGRGDDLADAYREVWDWGPAWRNAMTASLRATTGKVRDMLMSSLAGAVTRLGGDPTTYGLSP